MTKEYRQAVIDLQETFPLVVEITNNWLLNYKIHGNSQSKNEIETLQKFYKAMKIVTGLKNI